ncbi:MAG: hypothetical protein KME03_08980 [Aphanocapsa lilacina HA4352-LM1]|jgi:hypothetical protein|uniref:Uncharacterized protein n=1 Tax=Gloeobacter morelensis MG652769 TaxID=2781736 RepID=A0ABY3PQA8_9CYAN|nr:hypothetical protein [Gloeobacter morelensis]MBW4698012.1 hypothetical protein [Aphanocapsa lilacina HA4352-LM1]UFP95602.1 hypothetical protein ISF26_04990 [Gloeobacter morelensis MG652769]
MLLYLSLIGVGFAACVVIGSVAWYASKRPAGWEGAETPGWVKKLGADKLRTEG